jgi:hypothetical protein
MIRLALPSGAVPLAGAINWSHPLNVGRIGWWLTLPGRGRGAKVYDLTGQNHGSFAGVISSTTSGWQATRRPGGWGHIALDGVDDQVTLADSPSLHRPTSTNRISMAFWVWLGAAVAGKFINLVNLNDPELNLKGFQARINTTQVVFIEAGIATDYRSLNATIALPLGVWTHVVLTWDGTVLAIYINGNLNISGLVGGTASPLNVGTTGGGFGTKTSGDDAFFTGFLDDVGIWSVCFNASGVRSLYTLSKQGYPGVLNRFDLPLGFPSPIPPTATLSGASLLMNL